MITSYSSNRNVSTKACDEEQVLNSMSDGVCQGEVDKGLDVEMVHERKPGVITAGQRIRGQPIYRTTRTEEKINVLERETSYYESACCTFPTPENHFQQKAAVYLSIFGRKYDRWRRGLY